MALQLDAITINDNVVCKWKDYLNTLPTLSTDTISGDELKVSTKDFRVHFDPVISYVTVEVRVGPEEWITLLRM